MQRAPDYEVPTGAMPQAADHHGDDQIDVRHDFRTLAGQRKIQIIAQPVRKRDVPAAPEIGEVHSGVWHLEIFRQLNPKQQRGADRDVGVARKVVVDLESIRVNGDQRLSPAVEIRKVEDPIDQIRRQKIRDQKLLHEAHANQEISALPPSAASSFLGFSNC